MDFRLSWYADARFSMAKTEANSAQQTQGMKLLAVVEGEARKLPGRLPPALYAISSVLFVAGAISSLGLSFWWSLVWLVIILAIERRLNRSAQEYRRQLMGRIDRSAVMEKLIIGADDLGEIYAWTPWPWSIMFLGFRPKGLAGWLKLVSRNIEWYLREPRRYFKVRWAAIAVVTCYSIAFIAIPLLYRPALAYIGLAALCLIGVGLSLLSMFVTIEQGNQWETIIAMHKLLRLRFIEDLE